MSVEIHIIKVVNFLEGNQTEMIANILLLMFYLTVFRINFVLFFINFKLRPYF